MEFKFRFRYDFDRANFHFVELFNEKSTPIELSYRSDFDENGLIYWLGTNGKTSSDWVNPVRHGIVRILSSEGVYPLRLWGFVQITSV